MVTSEDDTTATPRETPGAAPPRGPAGRSDDPRTLAAGVAILALGTALLVVRGRLHPTLPPRTPHAAGVVRAPHPPPSAVRRHAAATPPPSDPGPAPPRPPAGAAELALVSPLVVGARLGDGEITAITAVQQGFMHVLVLRNGRTLDLGIGLGREGVAALRAGRYAVYILGSTSPDPASFPVADALARHVRANAHAPPPAAMSAGSLPPSPR